MHPSFEKNRGNARRSSRPASPQLRYEAAACLGIIAIVHADFVTSVQ